MPISTRVCFHSGLLLGLLFTPVVVRGEFQVIDKGQAVCETFVDNKGAVGDGPQVLRDAADWLGDALEQATRVRVPIVAERGARPCIVIARADAYPEIARTAGLATKGYDAFCVVTRPESLFLLGNSETAARHAVASLLHHLGFRYYAPSPKWHSIPRLQGKPLVIDWNRVDAPQLVHRGIWYAYGHDGQDKPLTNQYRRWAVANRLSLASVLHTGHSYGNIISRNAAEFDKHPEYYALLNNGDRDSTRAVNARKLCVSNLGLCDLVFKDRLKLLEEYQKANPAVYMVSVDPSDGEGTCHCEHCAKLGSPTDRVLHLANHVAKGLRATHPEAWVGLYAYSSHRLPPQIKVEPNVYVQVAMGFNRTEFSLPELIERWSTKVGAIGLREYYGVEAWDWGLPGRMRGASVAYHKKWIPYYAERKLNAINAETNSNWGGQMLGLYVASQLMWNPTADVDAIVSEYFQNCFGQAAEPMRRLYAKFDEAPALRGASLVPLFRDLHEAWTLVGNAPAAPSPGDTAAGVKTEAAAVRARLVDLMAYLVYVAEFREFDRVLHRAERDDVYYRSLLPLMRYAWSIRDRDMVHAYALARRLCNGLPLTDKRPEYYLARKDGPVVWRTAEILGDAEIESRFAAVLERLKADKSPVVAYSRYLDPVRPPGDDAGASRQFLEQEDGVATFRHKLTGYFIPRGKETVRLDLIPTNRAATVSVFLPDRSVLFEKEYRTAAEYQRVEIELPRANEYRIEIAGGVKLKVPPETPFLYEASSTHPAWIDYSGPHYFYVPKNVTELLVDANPRLSIFRPGDKSRIDVGHSTRAAGTEHTVIAVPPDAAGRVWHTSNQTRGQFTLLNVPPLLSFHRRGIFVPREVAESDGLTTQAERSKSP